MMHFDIEFLIYVALPGFVLSGIASFMVKSTFKKYAKVHASSGITGAQAAEMLMQRNGINDVGVEMVKGFLSDHYDPRSKTLRLSPDVYQNSSLSAIGVACHEAGHALQHAHGYSPLKLRSALVPATNFGSRFGMYILMAGMLLSSVAPAMGELGRILMLVGVAAFSISVIFAVVTLPVEWDATARAKKLMLSSGIVTVDEQSGAGKVLNAAFLTYLASAVAAIMTLVYYLIRLGLIGNRD